jgi:hypothetical protein
MAGNGIGDRENLTIVTLVGCCRRFQKVTPATIHDSRDTRALCTSSSNVCLMARLQ